MVLKFLALFYIILFYDCPDLHVRYLEENLLFSTLILGSVFSDYVVFYGDLSNFLELPLVLLDWINPVWRKKRSQNYTPSPRGALS